MSIRHRITTAEMVHGGRSFTITFQPDGIHVREKFAREEKIITLAELIDGKPSPTRANPKLESASIYEALDVAACDLRELAAAGKAADKATVTAVRESLSKAAKIVRSLEVVTP